MRADFFEFKGYLTPDDAKKVADFLRNDIRRLASDIYNESHSTQEAVHKLFVEIGRCVEDVGKKSANVDQYYRLTGNWFGGVSAVMALEAYYYLHTIRAGKALARKVDQHLFNMTFEQAKKRRIPGAYEDAVLHPEASASDPVLSVPPKSTHRLHYSHRSAEVLGRDDEWKALLDFVEEEAGFRWLQIAGKGGQGKSRLAYELVRHLGDEWAAGFLRKDDLEAFKPHWRSWRPARPHLIVVDYVIGHEAMIGSMMKALAASQREEQFAYPVCILLLERQRWDRGTGLSPSTSGIERAAWFSRLNGAEGDDLAHEDFRFKDGVIELASLSANQLVSIVRDLVAKNGAHLGCHDEVIAESLGRLDKFGRPLVAYLLAQAAPQVDPAVIESVTSLLTQLLDRDRNTRWSAVFDGHVPALSDEHPALRLALLATMVRQVDDEKLSAEAKCPRSSSTTLKQALTITGGALTDDVMGASRVIPALEPDILGGWFVLTALRAGSLTGELIDLAWTLAPAEMAAFLLRATQDFPRRPELMNLLEHKPPTTEAEMAYASVASELLGTLLAAKVAFPKEGIVALMRFAESGDGDAMFNLGCCYDNGLGVEKDRVRALDWWKRASDAGQSQAMFNIAVSYAEETEIDAHQTSASYWYRKAAVAAHIEAAHIYAGRLAKGLGIKKNEREAIAWYMKAAEAGRANSYCGLGVVLLESDDEDIHDEKMAFSAFSAAAYHGDSGGMFMLGKCYHFGIYVSQSYQYAVDYWKQAASAGHIPSMWNVSIAYRDGRGVPKNVLLQHHWASQARLHTRAGKSLHLVAYDPDDPSHQT